MSKAEFRVNVRIQIFEILTRNPAADYTVDSLAQKAVELSDKFMADYDKDDNPEWK